MLTLRQAQAGQNGRGGKYTLAQASQRCRRNSPAWVPSQKCWVSGVGFGRARAGSAMIPVPPCRSGPLGPLVPLLDGTLDWPASTVQPDMLHVAYSGPRIMAWRAVLVSL